MLDLRFCKYNVWMLTCHDACITILQWMTNLNPLFQRYLIAVGIVLLTAFVSQFFGVFIGAMAPSVAVANILAPLLIMFFFVFAGFFVAIDVAFAGRHHTCIWRVAYSICKRRSFLQDIPVFLRWFSYLRCVFFCASAAK